MRYIHCFVAVVLSIFIISCATPMPRVRIYDRYNNQDPIPRVGEVYKTREGQLTEILDRQEIEITSDPDGAVIEWNGEHLEKTPMKCEVTQFRRVRWDGYNKTWAQPFYVFPEQITFWVLKGKKMGHTGTIIKAIPQNPGEYEQTKIFRGIDNIPIKVYFNMKLYNVQPEIPIKVK